MPFDPSFYLPACAAVVAGATLAEISRAGPEAGEAPFRAELFSRDRLVEYARVLAGQHEVVPGVRRGQPLLRRLNESARVLFRSYQDIAAAARRQAAITPAAEWLLDNFHIVEEQLADIRKHLPRTYYAELPKLRTGTLAGYPRVYALALELIAHSDGALDEQSLLEFVRAYQSVAPLSIGELWAVAIMLRVGLVENLRRLTAPLESQRLARGDADEWANRLIDAATNHPGDVMVILGDLARRRAQLGGAFVVRLLQRLRGRGPAVQPVLEWLDRHLAEHGDTTAEELVRLENQMQAADQVSISNTISSFRLLATLDWAEFFESTSAVEALLRQDPARIHSATHFDTRDACRHSVERIARRCRRPETEVASAALDLARASIAEAAGDRRSDTESPHHLAPAKRLGYVGYFLIGDGCRTLEGRLGYRVSPREWIYRATLRHPTPAYLGSIFLVTCALLALVFVYVADLSAPPALIALGLLLALLPASDLAVGIVNRILTLFLRPRVLPKCDYSEGIPAERRTLVVIPALLTSEEGVDELLERLEVHYLANQDRNLHFALLSDYRDAPAEEMPEDMDLLHRAIVGVLALNERYEGPNVYGRFFLFHRPRLWNANQGCWMGWERKRGKLVELNRYLRGATDTSYTITIGDQAALDGVRYVICLDTDTQLPPGAAARLVGTLAHPLNWPVLDPPRRYVVSGYGVLQPRVSIALTSAARSHFTRAFSGNAGVDPYTTAVSDVYQDLFGEGIFCGKGIYEIDTFEAALEGRVGENQLLSHDLFEGNFARCGLVTDVELFDEYPARYNTYSARQHRWVRGDWQLLPWLFPSVRQADGERSRNPLSVISRWKIFDNLRRSMIAPSLLVLLAAGWLFLPGSPVAWTLAALLVVAFPIYTHLASALFIDPRGVPWTSYFWGIWYDALTELEQAALSLTFLAHQAWSMLDAIGRSLWRMFISHRHLLEWTSAADAEKRIGTDRESFWRRMWPATATAVVFTLAITFLRLAALPAAALFLVAWAVSPVVAWWVSLPIRERQQSLTEPERSLLRVTARRTWRFFEEMVTDTDHWLPPDNYQPDRDPPVAHRTSPTNIGLLLLSTLAARDLGYAGLLALVERLERTLWTVASLERYRGHLYNWYDTVAATPIAPFYVSTVDSGNLAGDLIVLRQACDELRDDPIFGAGTVSGLRDALLALRDAAGPKVDGLLKELKALEQLLQRDARSAVEWQSQLAAIGRAVAALVDRSGGVGWENPGEVRAWAEKLRDAVIDLERDLAALLPWARVLAVQPPPFGDGRPLDGDMESRPHIFAELVEPPPVRRGLAEIPEVIERALGELAVQQAWLDAEASVPAAIAEVARSWLAEVRGAFEQCRTETVALLQRFHALAELSGRLFTEMDFSFLYDAQRELFSVGYDVSGGRLDHYHYDLLASECRLASFVAIAKHDVPQKHWFHMGRGLTQSRHNRALVSWSGTMFEYMMPMLIMRAYEGTLLAQTLPAVVRLQQRFAARENVPWGMSESGFVARDPQMNYQYRAFGVPGLGLRPDLFEDLVVAPYATLLALPVAPRAAVRNLEALAREGLGCRYGFYESIDYTPARLQRGQRGEVVQELMAHHQGMSLVSLANFLTGNRMQVRFHADPLVKAAELLLQERNPREAAAAHPQTLEVLSSQTIRREIPVTFRHFDTPQTSTPRAQLLANGRYSVMVTNAGGSYSAWKETAVTRWREDVTRDCWGMFFYLRDLRSGEIWSAAYQPLCGRPRDYEVYFTEDKAEFRRRMAGIVSHLEVAVSAEDDVEVRRLTLTNTSDYVRELEVTSYAEVVLARPAADLAHTTFSNLFVETEFIPERRALLATRRPRSADQARIWAMHVVAQEQEPPYATQHETDRARFLGRGRTPADPDALRRDTPLSNSTGPVLDPIFSLRQRIRLRPHERVVLAFSTGVAGSREDALRLAERYHDLRAVARAFELAWTHSQVELRHLNLSSDQAHLCQRLASRILYVDSFVRPSAEVLARSTQGQPGLWAYGISGDLPIVLAQVGSFDHIELVRQLVVAHEYLRLKGLAFDLVIVNEHPPSYVQSFEDALHEAARNEGAFFDQPGGIFIRRADLIPDAGRCLLQFVARALFNGASGSLSDQLNWRPERKEPPDEFEPSRAPLPGSPLPAPRMELTEFNGRGGFSADGREYVILLSGEDYPPAPWCNVVANERFGFVASEAGTGFTWSENSRENRLTPWSNDPVTDPPGEAIYLRHEDTGRYWSVSPLPVRERNPYVIRHGPGYTRYDHTSHGVEQSLVVFVPPSESIKIFRLTLRNLSERAQGLSATFFTEWVLGVAREQTAPSVATALDSGTGAILARNSYSTEFAQRVAFADVNQPQRSWTADRTEFLGRNGSVRRPRALRRVELASAAGAELDPCAALQVKINLAIGAINEVVFVIGQGGDLEEARTLIRKYRSPGAVNDAFTAARRQWEEVLGAIQVKTPDPAFDLLLNRWLLYQVLACRVWARSGFYQSGGAFGFRDQLQDVMALVASGGALGQSIARQQILSAASRQFTEGDVQHWWHPPTGRGIRTRFSDDLLWLPFVASYYVNATGDAGILQEYVPFLHGRPLNDGEDEYYDLPTATDEHGSLYEHCLRAIRRGSTSGEHGLPLMGCGDWNDGMNRVGREGKGESVWVAWFLISVLEGFAPLCAARGEEAQAEEMRAAAERYRQAVEEHAWDGEWYRRAYFDDGTPLGSATDDECQIDSIAQSWAVISGAADPDRARQAMRAVEERLVRDKDGLILLFTPPFDKSALDPGYIKGYVPGVRENGGQYTHAALWTVLATALLGRGDRAHELFTLLNPIRHAEDADKVERYKVEPYVVAADVYGAPPHTGRGGWTWYTGSASWMYRVGLEHLLGFQLHGDTFSIDPCIPRAWPGFQLDCRRGAAVYRIFVENPDGVERGIRAVTLDGEPVRPASDGPAGIPAVDDGQEHQVRVTMGARRPAGERVAVRGA